MFKARSRQRLMRPDNRELRGAAALARAAAAPKPGAGWPRHRGGSGDRTGRGSTRSTPPSPWAGHVPTEPTEPTEPTQHFGGQGSGGGAVGVPHLRRAKGAPQCREVTGPGTCCRRRGWGGTGARGARGGLGGTGLPAAGRPRPHAAPAARSRWPRWGCAGARPGSGAPQSRLCAALPAHVGHWEPAGGTGTIFQSCPHPTSSDTPRAATIPRAGAPLAFLRTRRAGDERCPGTTGGAASVSPMPRPQLPRLSFLPGKGEGASPAASPHPRGRARRL